MGSSSKLHKSWFLFFNLILAIGGFPEDILASRTIFIPKKNNAEDPSDFRPITIGSVVVRHLHKIIASRLIDAGVIDERQRSLEDGCVENTSIIETIIKDS